MKLDRVGAVLGAAAVGCVLWAGVEARGLSRRPAPPPAAEEAAAVERSFRAVDEARRAGKTEEALLDLRSRAERGPHAGYAWFLLGELAWEEKAFGTAVRSYRRAVDLEAGVADRTGAFGAGRTLSDRLQALSTDPWVRGKPQELDDFRYLQRRLSGGCE